MTFQCKVSSAVPHCSRPRRTAGLNGLPALLALAALLLSLLAIPVAAQDLLPPAPYAYQQLDDPAKEAKAQALMETLRCLKCQSQSIADSDAPMAGDMRHQVRTRIAAGESPEHIRQWLIERYGDYVTYKPPVKPLTLPLFVAPVVFLALAVLLLRKRFRRNRAEP
jgi:cytochrome c-type biogenesis protein CcmH/NrfF